MPALVFCNRRWRIGSDDFVLPGLVEILVRLAWLVLVLLLFIEHEKVHCNQGSTELRIYLAGVMALLIVVITVTIMLVVFSARGSVMDGDKRHAVPTILMIRVILGFPEVAWNLLGSIWIFSGKIDCNDHAPLWILLKALLAVTWVALLLLLLTIVLLFEPMHRPQPPAPPGTTPRHIHPPLMVTSSTSFTLDSNMGSHYIQLWERRCRILCCASSKDETSLEALRNVADVLASIFEDNDLVASDIAAALVLLRLKQKYQEKREKRAIAQRKQEEEEERREEGRQTNVEQSGIAEETIAVTNHHSRHKLENTCDNASPNAAGGAAAGGGGGGGGGHAGVQLTEAPPPQYKWMTLANARHFMHFSLASYGWPWYVYGQCFTSMRAMWSFLSCCTPCCCRARPSAVHGDNCCLCHLAAMRAITGLTIDNFRYVYYYNNIYEVPFIVVVDDVTRSLVVAIRGTLSLKDAITDMTAQTEPVFPLAGDADDDSEETDRTRFLAHKGMVHTADFVYQKLKETQVLAHARVQYPDYQVVVTGHSLGAGAAVVLAARLRLDEQRRCRAALKKTRKRKGQKGAPPDGVSNHGYVDAQDGADKKGIGDSPCEILCYAYSPPGGLCSEAFAKLTRSFVMSVVLGDDIVPRLSMHSLHDLRVSIVRMLEDCHQPKYRLLAQGCWFMLFGISEGNLRKGFEDSHGNSQRRRRRRLEDVERHERDGEVGRRDEGSVTPSPTSSQPLLAIATTQPSRNYESTENISFPAGVGDSTDTTNISALTTDVLSEDTPQENAADQVRRRRSVHTPRHMETTLQLPGHILHVKPSGMNTPWLWRVSWQSPEFFRELLISPWMLRHHLPQEVMRALNIVMEMPALRQDGPTNLA